MEPVYKLTNMKSDQFWNTVENALLWTENLFCLKNTGHLWVRLTV